ncbi:MAG: M48 family metallopeptidase [Oscillospiraceae bacterium]|nr:M48 family metallopeptidase [Oscillospiraceae bacterium]
MNGEYIIIKDIQIPIVIKSYKTSKSVKIFFKNNKIIITKPNRFSNKNLAPIIKKNEDFIYNAYLKGIKNSSDNRKHWQTGEKIFYKGEEFEVVREISETKQIRIKIKEDEKQINIVVPNGVEEDIKYTIDKGIKELFKINTKVLVQERLPYWSKVTGIKYNTFTVRDAKTRYGSCVKKTKAIRFSSRLIMLPKIVADAIMVHELCHIVHANHSKDFYDLVKKYIPNYSEIDKWLKKNNKIIII